MRLRASTRAAAFAVAVAGFTGSMTGIAWAPKNLSVHVIETSCEVRDAGSGGFLGSVTLTGFTMVRDRLFATATVDGTCTLANGTKVGVPRSSTASVPVTVQELSCDELNLLLEDVSVGGMTIHTGGTNLSIFPSSKGALARFCAAERLAANRSVGEMLTPLSQLLFR